MRPGKSLALVQASRPDGPSAEQEERAQIAWGNLTRGDRTYVEIIGERVSVILRGNMVRVIVQKEGLSQVVTDYVDRLEIRAWTRNRAPLLRERLERVPKAGGVAGARDTGTT